jgi:hypothetical protein
MIKICIHCNELANNGTMTLCNKHTDELRALTRQKEIINHQIAVLNHKFYYIEDGDLGIEYKDSGAWRSYDISGAHGDDVVSFLENITISEIDQDGGELNTYGFFDAPREVQKVIDDYLKRKGY